MDFVVPACLHFNSIESYCFPTVHLQTSRRHVYSQAALSSRCPPSHYLENPTAQTHQKKWLGTTLLRPEQRQIASRDKRIAGLWPSSFPWLIVRCSMHQWNFNVTGKRVNLHASQRADMCLLYSHPSRLPLNGLH